VGGGGSGGTFSGVIMQGANAGNADVALVKIGTGTQILSGNNTYTAGTTVNGGTLLVNGQSGTNSGTGTGPVAVNNGGTFGGTGRAGGAVTVNNGGTIRGGDATAVGTLTIGGLLTFTTGARQEFRITDEGTPAAPSTGGSSLGTIPNPTNNNFINLFGGFNPTGDTSTYQFVIDGTGSTFNPIESYSYQVALSNGQDVSFINLTSQSQFTTVGFDGSPFVFSLTGNSLGAVYLNIAPVPEPATVLALAAGALGAGTYLRRRLRREQPAAQGA
jgi:autotransporter-associated beta strand protein